MHGLLSTIGEASSNRHADRVSRGMDVIRQAQNCEQRSTIRIFPKKWNYAGLASASFAFVAIVAFTIFSPFFSDRADASTTLKRLIKVAKKASDHRYLIRYELKKASRPEPIILNGELFVRPTVGVVQRLKYASGRELILGRSQGQFWIIPESGPVRVRQSYLQNRWEESSDETNSLSGVDELLEKIGPAYALTLNHSKFSPELNQSVAGIKATNTDNSASNSEPESIEIWYSQATGIVHQMELRWSNLRRLRALRLTLAEPLELPSSWYSHDAHHAPDREIVYLKNTL